jgi:SAM-dependent methyltransferase
MISREGIVSRAAVWRLPDKHLESLRYAELDMVRGWMKPSKKVLEIGGGSGYLASVLASWGCEITCLDIPGSARGMVRRFPVQEYDGRHLPFSDGHFDVVFSSNVLEHVDALDELLAETRRVLKPDGVAVHLMPSSAWRWWTSVVHYAYVMKCACKILTHLGKGCLKTSTGVQQGGPGKEIQVYSFWAIIKRVMSAGAHGAFPNAIVELYTFSTRRWLHVFETNGFYPVQVRPNRLFYTGCALLPKWSLESRSSLSRILGSAGYIYVLRPAPKT